MGTKVRPFGIVLLAIFALLVPYSAIAQMAGVPGVTVGPDGTVYIEGEIDQEGFDAINKAFGGQASDGSLTSDRFCDAVMGRIPGGGARTAADIGSLFGVCASSSEQIQKILDSQVYPKLKEKCEELSGSYPTTFSRNGCEIRGYREVICHFKKPETPPNCGGLRELCESAEVSGGMSPPDDSGPGSLALSYKIPGCVCESRDILEEESCQGTSEPGEISTRFSTGRL